MYSLLRVIPALAILAAIFLEGCGGAEHPAIALQAMGGPTCVTIQRGVAGVVEDATLSYAAPTKNFGASGSLTTGQALGGTPRASLLRFDLATIPAGVAIASAVVTVTPIILFDAQAPVAIHRALAPWVEGTVTFNSFGGSFATMPSATFPVVSAINVPVSTDITTLVQDWYSGAQNNGMWLQRDYTGGTTFATSEASGSDATKRPKLEVCYYPQGQEGFVTTSCSLPGLPSAPNESIVTYKPGDAVYGWGVLSLPPSGVTIRGAAVVIHGGRWDDGSTAPGVCSALCPADDADTYQRLATMGIVAISPAYRSKTVAPHPAQASDTLCAARYLRDYMSANHPSVNGALWTMGGSAGAHLSALIVRAPSSAVDDGTCPRTGAVAWRGSIGWSGVYDFTAPIPKPSSASAVQALLGYAPSTNPTGALAASPWSYVQPLQVAQVIAHGANDPTLPVAGSANYHAHALANGVDSTYVEITGPFGVVHAGALFDPHRPAMACTAQQLLLLP